MFEFFHLDWHTPTHFFGSCVLFLVLFLKLKWGTAAITAFFLGIIWEILDDYLAGKFIFDPRGGDWTDIMVDGCGVILGVLILHFICRKIGASH